MNLNFFMYMSCFQRRIVFATFMSFFVELKKFELKLIHELDFDWIIKTDLFLNVFMIRRRLSELFKNTSYILKFFRIAFEIIINILINLIVYVFCENSVIVCWLTIDEIKNNAFAKYFCIYVYVIFFNLR